MLSVLQSVSPVGPYKFQQDSISSKEYTWILDNSAHRTFSRTLRMDQLECYSVVLLSLVSDEVWFSVVRTDRSIFTVGRLSKRGTRGFEHNAAQSASSQWIQAKKGKKNKKRNRGLNLRQQLQRLTSYRLRRGIGASILPGAHASVWTSEITSFCLWKRGPIPRFCVQVGIIEERLSKCSILS